MKNGYTTIFMAEKLKDGYAIENHSICDSVPPMCNADKCFKHAHHIFFNENSQFSTCPTHTDLVIRDIEALNQ